MHLIEKYSLETGLKIGKPDVYEKFYPLPFSGKYVTQYVEQGIPSMQYDYWEDVIEIINPYLKANDIKILNLNPMKVKQMDNLVQLDDKIDSSQLYHIIKNSLLHFGETSFATDLACIADIKLLSIYSMAHQECLKPYWGKESNQILLSPENGKLPSYSMEESPKSINSIKPEKIASSILTLLGIDYKIEYETVFTGSIYRNKQVEVIPSSVANVNFYPMSIRMDYHFDEKNLFEQFTVTENNINIITDKPIRSDLLAKISKKVECLYYLVGENDDPKFIEEAKKLKIPFKLLSYLDEESINKKKVSYMDLAPIYRQKIADPSKIDDLKDHNLSELYYFSNKRLLVGGNVYLSKAAHDANDIHSDSSQPSKVQPTKEFYKELDCFRVVKKVS